jgi:hypothetical protein
VELPTAWLILRLGPQTSWPLRGAHLALIVCFCTRKEQRSPHDLLAQAAIFFCKKVGDLNSTGDIEPCVFWAWVLLARIRNISPVARKEIDPARIGFDIVGASYLLYRTIDRSFGHKNLSRVVSLHVESLNQIGKRDIEARRISGPRRAGRTLVEAGHSKFPDRHNRAPSCASRRQVATSQATHSKEDRVFDNCLQQTACGANNTVKTLAAKKTCGARSRALLGFPHARRRACTSDVDGIWRHPLCRAMRSR